MAEKISHIGEQAYCIWCKNVRTILELLGITHAEFAQMLGVKRSMVSTMLNRPDHALTVIQFHATMYALDKRISEEDSKRLDVTLARMLWVEIDSFVKKNGLH